MTQKTPAVVALGMFDGVHIGHRALVERLLSEAKRASAIPAVYTFSNHPLDVLGGSVRLLSGLPERNRMLFALGAEQVESVPFTREFAAKSTEQFVEMLARLWDIRALVVGYNYTCGDRGVGTPETLHQIGDRRGFPVFVVQPVLYEGEPVSSTRIREAIERGDVALAQQLLGRSYMLSGLVMPNKRIGHAIGFPTANIEPGPGRVIPADGVYATIASANGKDYRAVTNIGDNPTVRGTKRTIETYIIGVDEDLYGKTLSIAFRKMLRGERTFRSLDELKEQIRADIMQAEALPDGAESER